MANAERERFKKLARERWESLVASGEEPDLETLSPEDVLGGFVLEAKLSDPALPFDAAETDDHALRSAAYASNMIARGGLHSLAELTDGDDPWVAYCAAVELGDYAETRERALATLDRIAAAGAGGASASADTARNMLRHGHPLGAQFAEPGSGI